MLSGTSVDGLDVAVADLTIGTDDVATLRPVHAETVALPRDVRRAALAVLPPATTTAGELCRLDTEFGRFCGTVAAAAVREHGGELVASLGQTVFHWIEDGAARGTMQVGQPAWIAEATGLPVVSDLRARDVAAGGHGAPLASTLDALWLHGPERRAALNLGGIANLTVVGGDGAAVLAYDTGPANCLLDVVADRAAIREGFDVDGRLAAAGRVDEDLLDRLLAEPYFAQDPPKSTGRELFTADWLDRAIDGREIDQHDLAATLVELTARTVAAACRAHDVTAVVGSGGGMRNPVLTRRLGALLAPAPLRSTDELGLPADAKEAYLVALLGWLTWHGVPGVVPGGTGSRTPRVLGRITPGDRPLRLPEPLARVTGLVMAR
ncbi:anhydro-N-acetylmuramic acid kinase [Jatrophihabitans endophyticus]|uniref:Anhydro-N-acetylmuramic acid kinase n=2 Tax=Jatrophihabitans endophyticus TaxID=1206085 RepID=A0A1M5SQJ7_9ACTN|nr:anhydro-N-acetylmuramic acid kinase [Jatrophihabitans endophyticus]